MSVNEIKKKAVEMKQELISWRHHIHQHPELSFHEQETQKFVAEKLEAIQGMDVQKGVGYETSVIGTISRGMGPAIAIRADMDALPITEENTHDYVSENTGVMHACGHDAHTTIALGVAHVLAGEMNAGHLKGTIRFIFQPAEECSDDFGLTGAQYLVDGDVLEGMEAVIALHMSPEDSLGIVKVHDGYSMANVDVFQATIKGTGSHGAYPHLGTDPIWMFGPVMQAIHGIVARRVSPLEAAVVSIGQITSGTASNIVPSEVNVSGTIRTYKPDVRQFVHKELEKAFSILDMLGGEYELTITPEDPALNNHPQINKQFKQAIQANFPSYQILDQPFGLGGEDFAHMTNKVPGAMIFLGCNKQNGAAYGTLHTPTFDIDEDVLPVGVSIMATTVWQLLHQTAKNK